jgi:hypothetical protein
MLLIFIIARYMPFFVCHSSSPVLNVVPVFLGKKWMINCSISNAICHNSEHFFKVIWQPLIHSPRNNNNGTFIALNEVW